MKAFTARHTGMLSLQPNPSPEGAAAIPVYVKSDNNRVLIWHPTDSECISDPLAPIGEEVTYSQAGAADTTAVRTSVGADIISDETGHVAVRGRIVEANEESFSAGLTTLSTSAGTLDRWGQSAEPLSYTITYRTKGRADYETLRELAQRPGYLIVAHDGDACTIPSCTVRPIRVVAVQKATAQQTESRVAGTVQWELSVTERPSEMVRHTEQWLGLYGTRTGSWAPCVTWGEWLDWEEKLRAGDVKREVTYLWGGTTHPEDDKLLGDGISENWSPHGRPTRGGGDRTVTPKAGTSAFRQVPVGHTVEVSAYVRRIGGDPDLSNVSVGLWLSNGRGSDSTKRSFDHPSQQVRGKPDANRWALLKATTTIVAGADWVAPCLLLDGVSPATVEFAEVGVADLSVSSIPDIAGRTYSDVCRYVAGMPS
uniref:Uncharacterized protein n=1 Tax=Siphoviridae sp. ctgaU3 TaxID=2825609 RepID=A0A8S5UW37_9CAUD|nr:MAG TPA: hypothetical protein [Siphoviridae sp. ctgaU3]